MDKKQRLTGFDALLASHSSGSDYYEESDGRWRQWRDLSAEAKISYLARDAAFYDVPFERFAQAVRAVVGEQPVPVREEAYLRLALSNQQELHELESVLPDNYGMDALTLVDRVKEALNGNADPAWGDKDRVYDALFVHDAVKSAKTRIESFSDEFERLAKTSKQKELAAEFKRFVGEIGDLGSKNAFQKMLDHRSEPPAKVPETDRNKGIER